MTSTAAIQAIDQQNVRTGRFFVRHGYAQNENSFITKLPSYVLVIPIPILIEQIDGEFIVTAPEISPDLPVYGSGDSEEEAREMFCACLEYFYNDLVENEAWRRQWQGIYFYLTNCISYE